jgi:hypothetical protein
MICYVVHKDSVANKLSANIMCKVIYLKSNLQVSYRKDGFIHSVAFGAQLTVHWTSFKKVEGSKPAPCLFHLKLCTIISLLFGLYFPFIVS